MPKTRVTVDDIIEKIVNEQEALQEKKSQVKQLIEKLSSSLNALDSKSYRQMSSHLTGEVIKSLVTAHDLDIKLSNTLLRSYEQLARLIKEQEQSSEVSYEILASLLQQFGNELPISDLEGLNDNQEESVPKFKL